MQQTATISARIGEDLLRCNLARNLAAYRRSLALSVKIGALPDAACMDCIHAQSSSAMRPTSDLKAWAFFFPRRSTNPNDVGVPNSLNPKLSLKESGDRRESPVPTPSVISP